MSKIIKIKNQKGEWVPFQGNPGETSYDIALRHGYTGTKEEWDIVLEKSGGAWENLFNFPNLMLGESINKPEININNYTSNASSFEVKFEDSWENETLIPSFNTSINKIASGSTLQNIFSGIKSAMYHILTKGKIRNHENGTVSGKFPLDAASGYELDTKFTEFESTSRTKLADINNYIGDLSTDNIYGIEVNFDTGSITRVYGAKSFTSPSNYNVINAYAKRRRCILTDDGVVLAYYGETGYTETGALTTSITKGGTTYPIGTLVQVMVEQPKFYIKVIPEYLDTKIIKAKYLLSDYPKVGFEVHPAFIANGKVNRKIYLSAYESTVYSKTKSSYITNADTSSVVVANDKLSSIANVKPMHGISFTDTVTLANNRSNGWNISNVFTLGVSQYLFIVEYASMKPQAMIGIGVSSKTASTTQNLSENTGTTSTLGNSSGSVLNANGAYPVSYRGEENLWGNIFKWLDGYRISTNVLKLSKDIYTGIYEDILTIPNFNNNYFTFSFIKDYNKYPIFFPYTDSIDYNAIGIIGDWFYHNSTLNTNIVYGGDWSSSWRGGIFALNTVTNTGAVNIGSRLVYIPSLKIN